MSHKGHANIKTHILLSVQLSLGVISSFHREVVENCPPLNYNLTLEDGTDRMSQNFGR